MSMTNEQIQALKAAAENIDRGAVLDLWLRIAEVLNRGHKKVETALLTEAHAAMSEMLDLDKYFILSLLAEREADKALIAEQAKRIDELESALNLASASYAGERERADALQSRTLTVKLPERCECCYSEQEAALFDGVVEEYTEALESACAAAGITLVVEE